MQMRRREAGQGRGWGCGPEQLAAMVPCALFTVVVDSMIRFRDPVRVIQFATRSRSRIVRSFVRSVEFPVALTPLSLTDSAENRAMGSIP